MPSAAKSEVTTIASSSVTSIEFVAIIASFTGAVSPSVPAVLKAILFTNISVRLLNYSILAKSPFIKLGCLTFKAK